MLATLLISAGVLSVLALLVVNGRIARRRPAVGDPAPTFSLPDQHGAIHTLEGFRGRALVLYFYPRDDTPGCAEQAMRFRDASRDIEALGATVCGVSVDSSASHGAFARKYDLPFVLLADAGGATAARYGSLVTLGFARFARRNTFVIDAAGRIARVYLGVNAARNAAEVREALQALGT